MRRRLALLMATVLCVTSVPQTSLIGVAAEHAPETELVESTDVAVDSELQSDENLVGGTVETETAAVQETLAPETEAAVTEATPEPVTEMEPVTEGIPQENQSEAETTEAPQETEIVSEETQTTEVIPQEPQTEASEETTEVPQENEPSVVEPETEETEIVTETETEAEEAIEAETENEIAVQSAEGHEVAELKVTCNQPIYLIEEGGSFSYRSFWLDIVYANGDEKTFDLEYKNADSYGNEISKKIYKSDGTETSYTLNSYMGEDAVGDYYLEVTCAGKTVRKDFKIISLEKIKDNAIELEWGDNPVIGGYKDFYLYHFKVKENTDVIFEGDQKNTLCFYERRLKRGTPTWDKKYSGNSRLKKTLGLNIDYYIYFEPAGGEDISTQLTITKQPKVTKIERVNSKSEFLEKLETNYTEDLILELSYENQTKQQLKLTTGRNEDNYGNSIYCSIIDKDGNTTGSSNLPVGEYKFSIDAGYNESIGEKVILEIPFQVVDPKIKAEEIKTGEPINITLETNKRKYLYFIPENDCLYRCDLKVENKDFYVGAGIEDEEGNYSDFSRDVELEKGKIYYVSIISQAENPIDVTVEIQSKKKLEEIEVIPGSIKYLEDEYSKHFTDWKFRLKYTDGTTSEELKLEEEDTYRYAVRIWSVKQGTESKTDYEYGDSGEFTVTFYCDNLKTGEYTFYHVPLSEYVDYAGISLSLGKEETVSAEESPKYFSYQVPEGEGGYYRFSETGTYSGVYDDAKNWITALSIHYWPDQRIYYLKASQRYIFIVYNSKEEAATALLEKVPAWNMEEPLTVNQYAAYIITPAETSKYRFQITDQVTGETIGWPSTVEVRDTEDESYAYGKLTEGKKYLINIEIPQSQTENPCIVTAEPIATLKSIEVSADYSKMAEPVEYISGIDLKKEGIKVVARYSNGTTEEVIPDSNGNRTDSENRDYSLRLLKDGSYIWDTEDLPAGIYTVRAETYDSNEGQYLSGDCEIVVRTIKEAAEKAGNVLAFDTVQTFKNGTSQPAVYYSFTPETTGRYEFEFSDLIDGFVVTDENNEKLTGITISDQGYQLSLNQGQTYYFAVVGGPSEKTVKVTKAIDVSKVDIQIEKADSYIGGIDRLKTKDVELRITYDNNETATIKGGEKDSYGNYFRLKASRTDEDYAYKLRTGSSISLYSGNYTISASLRNARESIGTTDISVKKLNVEELTEIKAGEAFEVKGGRQFFRISPEKDEKYYVEQAPYGSNISFYGVSYFGESFWTAYPSEKLWAGVDYLVEYEGNAGKVTIKTVPQVTKISLESTTKPVEYLDKCSKYRAKLALLVEYAGGRKEKVYDEDSYGNVYERELRDSNNSWVGYSSKLKAGTYSLLVSGGGIKLNYPVEVQSIEEQAQNLVVAPETTTAVAKGENQHAVFFAYKATKSGRQELIVNNKVNNLAAVDEDGQLITLTRKANGDYAFSLNAGSVAYFAVDTDSAIAKVNVKSIANVVSASLETKQIYYAGIDSLYRSDLQLMTTYTDGTSQLVEEASSRRLFRDSYGNNFRFEVEMPSGYSRILSGSSIYLQTGEYTVNAYLNEGSDILTSTTIQTQEIVLDDLPEIYAEKAFEVKGNGEKEFFQFTPEEDGIYKLEKGSTGNVSFRRRFYGSWGWEITLTKGQQYLVIYEGDTASNVTIVKKDSDIKTSTGGVLELDKSYDVSIGNMDDEVTFTFVPEEDGTYCLDSKEADGIVPSFILYENQKKVCSDTHSLSYEMKAGKKYTFKVGISWGGADTYKITLSKQQNPVTQKPSSIRLTTSSEEKAILGVQGIHTPEALLSQMELYIQFAGDDDLYWSGLHFGENRDSYGNTYEVSVTSETETALGREYQITVTCGELRDSVKAILLPEDSLELLNLNEEKTVSFDGVEARQKYYRFNPEKTGYYSPTVSGKGTASFWQVEDMAGNEVRYRDGQNGYYLKTGETYYLRLSWYAEVSGSAAVIIQKSIPSEEESCSHNYIWVVDQDATCGTAGSRHQECSICHERGTTETIPATGNHTYQTIVDIAATCGSAGSQHEECTVCHTQKAATAIPATGQHQYVEVTDTVPTCGSTGTQHKECSICHTRENAETVAATGNHKFTMIVDRAATCGAAGSQHEECTVCHVRKEAKAIPATGNHKFKTVVDRAASCGAAGSQHQECTVCHTKKETKAIPATGKHSYGAYKTVKAATIYAAGKEERKCSVCGTKQSRTVRKLTAKISVAAKSTSVVVGSRVTAPKVTYANGDRIASWKTSNKAVATVDKYGRITGKKAGTAIITVTLKSKKYARIKVTVKKKVAAIRVKLNRTSLTLKRGASFQLRATVTPKNTTDTITYKTSNKNIVSVTSRGKLVAVKRGRATITVTVGKKKASCRVVVK